MREYNRKQYNKSITGQYTACILYAVNELKEYAFGMEIHNFVESLLDQKFDPAQTYTMLNSSRKKGWLDCELCPSPKATNRKVKLHTLTEKGRKIYEASTLHYQIDHEIDEPH